MADSAPASPPAEFVDPQRDYRTIEPWAIGGLVIAVLSSAALAGGPLWLLAALGIATNLVALVRLRRDANRSGRPAALCGLALSIIFGVAPAAQIATAWFLLSRQSQVVADQFFEFLREDSPEKAMMLLFDPNQREPFDALLWTFYRHDAEAKDHLREFVEHPVVRAILALGPRADVRFYKTANVVTDGSRGVANCYYAVTYPAKDGKQTFFVSVLLERNPTKDPRINPWRVLSVEGGIDPSKKQSRAR